MSSCVNNKIKTLVLVMLAVLFSFLSIINDAYSQESQAINFMQNPDANTYQQYIKMV